MIDNKLYRKVNCKDRLPEKSRKYEYLTDKGTLYWYADEEEWSCNRDRISEEYPKWWLEEVEMPTDEEIESEYGIEKEYYHWDNRLKIFGAKKMRDKIFNNE